MPSGGKREGAGRPKGSTKETHKPFKHLSIHCSPEEVEMIKAKAEKAGKPVGRYLIDLAKNN